MASNIVGEGFENYVIDQIQKRQEILGKPTKSSQDLIWENSRTGFVKLISSANIKDLSSFGSGFTKSSELAEKFVLFNGVTDETPTKLPGIETIQRGGIDPRGFATNTGAYGLGGTQWGFNPMPGIISANIRTEARGSLRTATINVKANNKEQFELINTLYLRLGYLMLLEWGHNCYYKNNGSFISDTNVSLADAFLTPNPPYSYNGFLEQIKLKRKETDGNYDALVGKVVNFNWTFNKDGSYDIVIILRSIGDVIESLKVNLLSSDKKFDINQEEKEKSGLGENTGFNSVDKITGKVTSNSIIVAFANAHSIGAKFADIQYEFFVKYAKKSPKDSNLNGMQFLPIEGEIKDYIVQEYDNNLTNMFVRFGAFLDILNDLVIPSVKGGGKIISFGDTKDIDNKILSYSPGGQISSDPRICTFRQVIEDYTISGAATDPFYKKNDNNYIKLMNVYFNFVFILHLLEDLKDKNGKVPLVDFLNAMWKGYCQSTGNYNNITVGIDDESNEVIFIDETALPDREDLLINKKYATFDVYGFVTNPAGSLVGGSFVRDLQLKTEITSDLATMITVGSTANGYITGQDATILSNLNNNTTPRISSELISPNTSSIDLSDPNPPIEVRYFDTLTAYERFIEIIGSYNNSNLPKWNEDAFTQFTNTQTQLLEYQQQYNTNIARTSGINASSPNDGFLPFNLSLTMDGLSGMKVYQRYTINSTFLPKSYYNSIDFIIKRIDHNIQNNTWTTNIESFAIPKIAKSSPIIKLFQGSPTTTTGEEAITSNSSGPVNSPVEHANINYVGGLRNLIVKTAKKYNGITEIKNTLGFRPNTLDFENKIKGVGWTGYEGAHWCNWFANLVWKEAYNEYAKTNSSIKPTISDVFNDFKLFGSITPPLTSKATLTFNNMQKVKGNNYTIKFQKRKSVPKPGDMIIYSSSHVAICGEVDPVTRRYERIDGNWGVSGQGKVKYTPIDGFGTFLDGTGDGVEILGFISPPYADIDDLPAYLPKSNTSNQPSNPYAFNGFNF